MNRLSIRMKIIIGYMLLLACLLLSMVGITSQIDTIEREVRFVANRVVGASDLANSLETHLLDMETGQRGFVITGNPTYLEPYQSGRSSYEEDYMKLMELVKDSPVEVSRLERIYTYTTNWIQEAGDPVIEMKRSGDTLEIVKFFNDDVGKQYMDKIRSELSSFREFEQELANSRVLEMEKQGTILKVVLYAQFVLLAGLAVLLAWLISRSVVRTLRDVTWMIHSIAAESGDYSKRVVVQSKDEISELAMATNQLIDMHAEDYWIKSAASEVLRNCQDIDTSKELSQRFITSLARALDASYGILYVLEGQGGNPVLARFASYAAEGGTAGEERIALGEGLVGQCALDGIVMELKEIPAEHVSIVSSVSKIRPRSVLVAPIKYKNRVIAVIELAGLGVFEQQHRTMIRDVTEPFGTMLNTVENRMEIERLLHESQTMTEELQAQSEELQMQQEELRMTNEQLEEQNRNALQKTNELNQIRIELEQYALKLEQSSQYKSEFLANMSHELRTPLNSMLILSQMLAENAEEHLSHEEEEYARVIYTAGKDLLNLINDILDLSKVEAGKLDIVIDAMNTAELPLQMRLQFDQVAEQKDLEFVVEYEDSLPDIFYTDEQRLHQIVRNLLSNAFKFTEKGSVTMRLAKPSEEQLRSLSLHQYASDEAWLALSVQDTGIGIAEDKRAIIFEAFQQADGRTSRKYGGTGLGLSICRELSRLLGGKVFVDSEEGVGSTFTVIIPSLPPKGDTAADEEHVLLQAAAASEAAEIERPEVLMRDAEQLAMLELVEDAGVHRPFAGKKVLVVDDDIRNVFALMNILEKEGVEVIAAHDGEEGLAELSKHPDIDLVLMDIMMPVMDGYDTIQEIRNISAYSDLPIIALTAKAMKQDRERCLEVGASDYISKPINLDQLFSLMRVWLSK